MTCYRLVSWVIIECQNHDDYWESIKWLLEYTEEYAGHGRKAAEHGKDSHATFTSVSSYSLPVSVHSHTCSYRMMA
jgi:hypothetical protein